MTMAISSDGQYALLLMFLLHFAHKLFLLLTDASMRFCAFVPAAAVCDHALHLFQEKLTRSRTGGSSEDVEAIGCRARHGNPPPPPPLSLKVFWCCALILPALFLSQA